MTLLDEYGTIAQRIMSALGEKIDSIQNDENLSQLFAIEIISTLVQNTYPCMSAKLRNIVDTSSAENEPELTSWVSLIATMEELENTLKPIFKSSVNAPLSYRSETETAFFDHL